MRSPSVLGGVKLFLLNNADPIKITVLVSVLLLVIIRIYGLYENAKIQSDRAEANFTIAHSLLSDYLEVVSETVGSFAQIDTVTELLNKTIGLIERPLYGDDGRIALERALAFVTSAEISLERKEVDRTRDLAIKAIEALARVPENDSRALEAQHLMARSERLIGVFHHRSTQPDQKKALDYYDSALFRLKPLEKRFDATATSGTEWRWLRTLARLQQDKGDLLEGQIEEADQQYRTSLATFKKLYRLRTMDPQVVYEMAWVANKIGDALLAQGQDDQALSQIKEAREGIKHLGEQQLSKHPRFRHSLSIVENHIGLVLRSQQHYAEAIESFKEAKAEIEQALEHDPNQLNWLSVLSWTNDNLGETRVRWARAQKNPKLLRTAEDELKQALATKQTLVKNAPKFARWQVEPTITLANIQALNGTEKELMGDYLGAANDFRYAAERNPEVKDDRADDMVLGTVEFREWSGLAFRSSGKRDDAERELNKALKQISQYRSKIVAKRATFTAIKKRIEEEIARKCMV
jgi:tetratricopeptide (TPR) repeat protein